MIKLHFYKGPGRIGDKAIRFWTHSRHSHVEIEINGVLYSADMWTNRVRAAHFTPDKAKWDTIAIPATDEQKKEAISFLRSQLGRQYDVFGILFSQFVPLSRHHNDKWFCSELCHAALKIAFGIPGKSHEIDPGELYQMIRP